MSIIPQYWKDFVKEHSLEGVQFDIPEEKDKSEVSATFEILSEKNILDEMDNFYPGLIVKKDHFIPIANCSIGSGDPYFINSTEGENGKLYRIYHDEVFDENYNKKNAIAIVLDSYKTILNFIEP